VKKVSAETRLETSTPSHITLQLHLVLQSLPSPQHVMPLISSLLRQAPRHPLLPPTTCTSAAPQRRPRKTYPTRQLRSSRNPQPKIQPSLSRHNQHLPQRHTRHAQCRSHSHVHARHLPRRHDHLRSRVLLFARTQQLVDPNLHRRFRDACNCSLTTDGTDDSWDSRDVAGSRAARRERWVEEVECGEEGEREFTD